MDCGSLLVSVPHSGLAVPPELSTSSLSEHQDALAQNNDWYTNLLYDFTDLLGNQQLVFRYSQVFVNVNRHPMHPDECVPRELDGLPVYRPGSEPSPDVVTRLIARHHHGYHHELSRRSKGFILDGHSTVTGHVDASGMAVAADIILSDRQCGLGDPSSCVRTAPEGWLDRYAEELHRRLAGWRLRIEANTTYTTTYGHVMAVHGWDGEGAGAGRAPLLLQETNEALYVRNGVPDVAAIEALRRAFAAALEAVLKDR